MLEKHLKTSHFDCDEFLCEMVFCENKYILISHPYIYLL